MKVLGFEDNNSNILYTTTDGVCVDIDKLILELKAFKKCAFDCDKRNTSLCDDNCPTMYEAGQVGHIRSNLSIVIGILEGMQR